MMQIEELVVIRGAASQVRRALLTPSRWREWQAPDITMTLRGSPVVLAPGDRFRLAFLGGLGFEYLVEAVSDREVVFAFEGPWQGRERWSFVPDAVETVVRRQYEVDDRSLLETLAFRAAQVLLTAHFKFELARFRAMVERDPIVRAEIEAVNTPKIADVPPSDELPFPIDEG